MNHLLISVLMRYNILFLLFSILTHFSYAQIAQWEPLFNGKDLNNWEVLNGKATYSMVGDSIITGTSMLNTPNTFLATREKYSDFVMEVDVWVDNSLNSGIQIRSGSTHEYKNGRVHGYQVEIDPSKRAFSGGLYDEARRGWLYPVSLNDKGRIAFQPGGWNTYHIEAIGKEIRVWVNDIMVTHLVDDMADDGFIALQVHSIGNKELENKKVKWKNPRILTTELERNRWTPDPEVPEVSFLINNLTESEKRKGWRLLWDGKTSDGWRSANSADFPSSGWRMEEGMLTVLETDGAESTGPGDIITVDQYGDFELELEFKITKGANSGIKYFVQSGLNKGVGSSIGCEFQILDDINHTDAKEGINGNRTVGSLYDLIAAGNLSAEGRAKQFKGIGKWNKARIVSKGGHVEHWLNGERTVEYDRNSQMFRALVAYSKYSKWPDFGQWPQGHILLQDHGDTVHYRSIKIREF